MATSFPSGLDSFVNPSASDALDSGVVPHAAQHANVNDAVEALEAKVGVDGSAVATSLDYKLNAIGTYDDYTPSFSGIAFSSYTARWTRINDMVHVYVTGVLSGPVTGTIEVSLPVNSLVPSTDLTRWGTATAFDTGSNNYREGRVELRGSIVRLWGFGSSAANNRWDSAYPFTWASGDLFSFDVTYEAA